MTRHSLVVAAQSNDPATRSWAIEAIAAAYWRPVYKYMRSGTSLWKTLPTAHRSSSPVFWKRNSSILTTAVKEACALFYERVLTIFL
jgi:hypothetical protein